MANIPFLSLKDATKLHGSEINEAVTRVVNNWWYLQGAEIEDFVFISPYTVLTNDPTPPSEVIAGVKIGKYSQVTTSCVLLPGAVIGRNCLVAAHSTVGGVYEDFSLISGSPSKRVCDVRKAPFFNQITGKRQYPWQRNFERNMPWAGMGFDRWCEETGNSL